jgi:hypothetical protein
MNWWEAILYAAVGGFVVFILQSYINTGRVGTEKRWQVVEGYAREDGSGINWWPIKEFRSEARARRYALKKMRYGRRPVQVRDRNKEPDTLTDYR